ncbi:MAG: sulfotransferase [Sphingobium sp.]|nr:sulfotransferase [Sphingobium sp.]
MEQAAIALLQHDPLNADGLKTLFRVLHAKTRHDAATIVIERLALHHQNDPVVRISAIEFYLSRNEVPRAMGHGRMLIRLAPEAVLSHFLMGRVFMAQHNPKAAEHHFRIALKLPIGRGPEISVMDLEGNLALTLRDQGKFNEAREMFRQLDSVHGPNLTVLLSWAQLEEAAQDFDQSETLLDRADALAPANARVGMARAILLRRRKKPQEALNALESMDSDDGIALLQQGQVLDSMGRYDEAFDAFDRGKAKLRERTGQAYLRDEAAALVGELKNFFTAGRTRLLPRAVVRSDFPQPIFIVGFPRSGTTLLEQSLTAHSDVAAGDELPIIHTLTGRLPDLLGSLLGYPKALSELWLGDRVGHINNLRDHYLNEALRFGAADPSKRWFTDKMPLNETHLGLINLLFPESPIIHMIRHPLDVVTSVYSNFLTHGFHCSMSLESSAEHFAIISDLVNHYMREIPLRYMAVKYEELIDDQEAQVRAIADYIGLSYEPAMLDFQSNTRAARTASYAQVTEPLYRRSRFRYRNYLSYLAPVVPILRPAIDRLGYDVDQVLEREE